MKQRGAAYSLGHAFQAAGCEVTAQLRVSADFRHTRAPAVEPADRLSVGIDIEVNFLNVLGQFPEAHTCSVPMQYAVLISAGIHQRAHPGVGVAPSELCVQTSQVHQHSSSNPNTYV